MRFLLNSVVSRSVCAAAICFFIMSCTAIDMKTAYESCPVEKDEWRLLFTPPTKAPEILASAKLQKNADFSVRRIWFSSPNSTDLLLCESPRANVCGGTCGSYTWHLYNDDGTWRVADNGERIVVCGCP